MKQVIDNKRDQKVIVHQQVVVQAGEQSAGAIVRIDENMKQWMLSIAQAETTPEMQEETTGYFFDRLA